MFMFIVFMLCHVYDLMCLCIVIFMFVVCTFVVLMFCYVFCFIMLMFCYVYVCCVCVLLWFFLVTEKRIKNRL